MQCFVVQTTLEAVGGPAVLKHFDGSDHSVVERFGRQITSFSDKPSQEQVIRVQPETNGASRVVSLGQMYIGSKKTRSVQMIQE